MRRGLSWIVVVLAAVIPSTALAQLRERVKITNVRLGFPQGGGGVRGGLFKAGQWAPVYVDLECVRDTDPDENLLLIVETRDADDAVTEGTVEIPAMKKEDRLNGNELGRIPYLKPGSPFSATVAVRVKGAKSGRTYGELSERMFSGLDTPAHVFLGVGANLVGLRDDTGWIQVGNVVDVGLLPDQWIGYGSIDMIVIGTGADRDFWLALAAPQHDKRRKALAEWVRRGGRLVVSVGSNPDLLDALKELKDILPATVPPASKRTVNAITFNWVGSGTISERNGVIAQPGGQGEFPVCKLDPKPDRPTKSVLVEDVAGAVPLAVQGAHGLGRVTVVAFDLDRPPFTEWNKRTQFWINLVNHSGRTLPATGQKLERYSSTPYDDLTGKLQGSLDFFEGVPVVSFGWVALFILIYIVLIGPVDYLFLKKVVRRLEWTWVTFPVIVIAVSAGAYFAAYALKGKDLKINKVDVVDIDLAGKRVDGNTWFTLFSPRIQNYTIGVEPAGSEDGVPSPWTPATATNAARDTIVSWQAHVEQNKLGGSSGGLFSKRYRYQSGTDPVDINRDLYAAGLDGVPIQVWTTKAFHAEWTAPIDPNNPPIAADFRRIGDSTLAVNLTNNLPVEIFTDAAVFWRGRAFILDPPALPKGVSKATIVSADPGLAPSGSVEDIKSWVLNQKRYPPDTAPYNPNLLQRGSGSFSGDVGTTKNPNFRLWPVLFSDIALDSIRQNAPNASLRRLDQSWRVTADHPEHAILVLRIATEQNHQAEEFTRDPQMPPRLWLGDLPTNGGRRPALQGSLKQETYIRVLIPVKPSKK